ncbi:SMP-30/gluconolactonase/LRE family protein [Cyclobacterium plantarum]|uniref:SMP-30/gluconolactonase/LRE family protein n=1 Tax=Cyclobacterium plantarum TaxID=2716263 RepID=A0ABX0HA99_9BACT|nr:SMP-30/gluconolactonase/LRE family protein [Cyclobacterium plantarum]NHE57371.1 SMP-30/gluconolactonase/LRE family protein [Cyclobacterium plantarum]
MKADLLVDAQCILAESPTWHKGQQCYMWVDIEKGHLYKFDPVKKDSKKWEFPHRLSLVVPGQNRKLVLALDAKLARFDPETSDLSWLAEVEEERPENRFNDGSCDAKGRLWAGTMSTKFTQNAGALYCMDLDLKVKKKIDLVTISNGICWSLDQKTMYYIDSPTRKIQAFDFDIETGFISFKEIAVSIPEEMGTPDGMCMDQNGKLWVAHYGGFGVYQWDPKTGMQLDKIDVAAPHVTSCAFVGPENNELLITTARENLSDDMIQKYPQSGGVFLCKMPVRGAEVFEAGF